MQEVHKDRDLDTTLETEEYWLRTDDSPWRHATKEEFITEERAAGFRSKNGPGTVATGSFSSSKYHTQGRVTFPVNTHEDYSWDPDFAEVMRAHRTST